MTASWQKTLLGAAPVLVRAEVRPETLPDVPDVPSPRADVLPYASAAPLADTLPVTAYAEAPGYCSPAGVGFAFSGV